MKLFEEIELRLSRAYQRLKKKTDRNENAPFITEEELYSYDLALEHYKQAIQAEYDKLCPKPSEFEVREASRCWALHPINTIDYDYLRFNKGENLKGTDLVIDRIPPGIDYRLCCWSIEDAKRIWGDDE